MTDYSSSISSYDDEIDTTSQTTVPETESSKKSTTRRSGTKRRSAKTSDAVIREALETYDKLQAASESELAIMAALLSTKPNALDITVARSTKSGSLTDVSVIVSISGAKDIDAMVEAAMLVEDKASLRRVWTILDAASGTAEDLPVSRTHTVQLAASLVRRVRDLDAETIRDLTSAATDLA